MSNFSIGVPRRTSRVGLRGAASSTQMFMGSDQTFHVGSDSSHAQLASELALVKDFKLGSKETASARDYEFLFIHALSLAQLAREAMESVKKTSATSAIAS